MNTDLLISVGIIIGIAFIFASLGYLCCHFKSKCTALNEPEPEFGPLRFTPALSSSQISTETDGSDGERSAIFRRTLFQIAIGQDPTQKPSRVRGEKRKTLMRWSPKVSFFRKAKVSQQSKRQGRICDLAIMEEGLEADPTPKCDEFVPPVPKPRKQSLGRKS